MNKDLCEAVIRPEQQEFTYFAFISYSHKDMKWARWLQKKLETYKLPSKLQETDSRKGRKSSAPIQPVFRDETSINPGKTVDDALKSELEKSKYLIVICSTASSASTWVNREVERFIEMGREDRIMPFIIEGVPHSSNPQKECYVSALRALAGKKGSSILGADVQARGKREAFLCTVAFLLGIDLETLRSREAERARRKRISIIAVSAVFVALFVFCGYKVWDYYVPKILSYQDYTMRFGLPEGLVQLTKQQIQTLEEHYEITIQYGRIQSLAHKNQYGTITDRIDSERFDVPAYMTFDYDEKGNLISSTRYLANGSPVVTWKYTDNLKVVQFEYPENSTNNLDNEGGVAMTLAANTQNMEADAYRNNTQRSFIAGYIFKYTDDGLIRDLYYSDMPTFGRKTKDANGIWGIRYDYNTQGQVTQIQYLNEDGELLTSREGIAQKTYSYDNDYHIIKVEYKDAKGNLVMNSEGWAIDIQEYENGNIVAEETRDTEGNLVINGEGWARLNCVYDQNANMIEMYATGVNGEPIIDYSGWHRITYSYDELGRETERKGYSLDGNPINCCEGYASFRSSYDQDGNCIATSFFDEKDNKAICNDGYASWKAEYNDHGKLIKMSYFDENCAPTLINKGYAAIKWTLDNHDNPIEYAYFGIDNEPVLNNDGVAVLRCKYDARGNEIEEAFYDTAGKLSNCNYGYAILTSTYDKQGNLIETAYYGENSELSLVGIGYAIERLQYDDKGNMIEVSYHGTDSQLVIVYGGYAGWTSKFDEFGNEIERSFFDSHKELIENDKGYAVQQIRYDAVNNPIEILYFDSAHNQIYLDDDTQDLYHYRVAFTDLFVALDEDWVFADRNIKDDSEFCIGFEMTAKEFVNEYLSDDCFALAFDTITGSYLWLYINESNLKDYSDMSYYELAEIKKEMSDWLTSLGDTIMSNDIIDLNTTYNKTCTRSDDTIYVYYETVTNRKIYTFMFMIDIEDWDTSYDSYYNEVVGNITY